MILRAVSSRQSHVIAFPCQVLVWFVMHVIFLAVSNELMQSVRAFLPSFYKVIRIAVVVEYFLSKVANLQPEFF